MNRRELIKAVVLAAIAPFPAQAAPREWVTLRLTPAEAQALANITSHVGGHPELSDRGHIDTIGSMLWEQGYSSQCGNVIEHIEYREDGQKYSHYNSLHLRNYSEYQHTYPPGPGRKFQHKPELRYLRRQRDGVVR